MYFIRNLKSASSGFGPKNFGKGRFGPNVSAPRTFRQLDVSASRTFRHVDVSAPRTFRHLDISAPRRFGPWTFRPLDISAPGHFGPQTFSPPKLFDHRLFLVYWKFCSCKFFGLNTDLVWPLCRSY